MRSQPDQGRSPKVESSDEWARLNPNRGREDGKTDRRFRGRLSHHSFDRDHLGGCRASFACEGTRAWRPVGADCVLMAQALRSASFPYPVIGSDRQCRWRALGIPNAISYDQLPPDEDVANRTVETPRYSYGGLKAEVDVGVVLAPLAGAGKNCTYYRFWGAWHRAGCEGSWVA